MRIRRIALVPVLSISPLTPLSGQVPDLAWVQGQLEPGPHVVGYRLIHLQDSARSFGGTAGTADFAPRTVQVSIWFPASTSPGAKPVRYRDYIESSSSEVDPNLADAESRAAAVEAYSRTALMMGVPSERVSASLDGETRALLGGEPILEHSPLVLYLPSIGGSPYQNHVLLEYLASHGYTVVSIPGVGTHGREQRLDGEDLETQISDIAFALQWARRFPGVDPDRIGMVGFSLGGLSAVAFAQDHPEVGAVVSVDGSIAYLGPPILRELDRFHPGDMRVPTLLMLQKRSAELPLDVSYLGAVDRTYLTILQFHQTPHLLFSSWALGIYLGDPVSAEPDAPYDRNSIVESYLWACRYTLAHLNANLREDGRARAFLSGTPPGDGVPPGILSILERIQAVGEAPGAAFPGPPEAVGVPTPSIPQWPPLIGGGQPPAGRKHPMERAVSGHQSRTVYWTSPRAAAG